MIEAEGLQHAPEAVAQVDGQNGEGDEVEHPVENAAEGGLDGHADRDLPGGKGESEDMDQDEQQDEKTGIRHGVGRKRVPGLFLSTA